jgi:hypothetical protein
LKPRDELHHAGDLLQSKVDRLMRGRSEPEQRLCKNSPYQKGCSKPAVKTFDSQPPEGVTQLPQGTLFDLINPHWTYPLVDGNLTVGHAAPERRSIIVSIIHWAFRGHTFGYFRTEFIFKQSVPQSAALARGSQPSLNYFHVSPVATLPGPEPLSQPTTLCPV